MPKYFYFLLIIPFLCTLHAQSASAHEVYVLNSPTIAQDVSHTSPNPFAAALADENGFMLWGIISVIIVVGIFLISITKGVEILLDPILFRLKKWAPLIARITLGSSLLASAYFNALFGPELPLTDFVGGYAPVVRILLYLLGGAILLGIFTRISALLAIILFLFAIVRYGTYMLTYANYFGEMIVNLLLGSGIYALDRVVLGSREMNKERFLSLRKYGFLILRVMFGIAVIFASYYAKFLHSQLAVDTVTQYHLTAYFHFDPLFVVLGAFIVEFLIGLFFIIGFEIRFTALVFLCFLTLSLLYFGEAVWPHLILIGVNIALFAHGYDEFTIESKFLRKNGREPVF